MRLAPWRSSLLEPGTFVFAVTVFIGVTSYRLFRGDRIDSVSPTGDLTFKEATEPVRKLRDATSRDVRTLSERLLLVEQRLRDIENREEGA